MSHFTVLVIGDDVEKQLQPYHEYECTGTEDEYVVDVNKDDEVKKYLDREIYVGTNKETGKLDYHFFEERANEKLNDWKIITQLEYFQSQGMTQEEIDEEIADNEGVKKKEDGSWYQRTNPNSKWDWWVVGGRWSGFLKLKEGAEGETGSPGFFGSPAEDGYVDIAMKKDIDFEGMFKEKEEKAIEEYDKVYKIIKDTPVAESWKSVRERLTNIEEAREFYRGQERVKAFSKDYPFNDLEDFQVDKDVYIRRQRAQAISTYAIVKDSKWFAKGEMGWWAVSTNEIEQDEWNQKVLELIESVPDDTLFTLVDCHI